ncbi:efflux RND transporter periplasmic adaptor subunit [Paucibacter sp. PLA-PC-4]|uniref:efflux RND transporter periplasmic adaptor subunit n=1 Tax=Paucibacter sp. PLA-PC-4 TaxID=2993655 RepID=UPI00224B1326|nr:efflux RND transporter periplasmic adaptor subunit [Paucibacter sp. PLA-PC-4]MCX2864090.1 efflux RND transporter periplasmic adaptor subunit [Paucibacter sp. PLA-PC-4]
MAENSNAPLASLRIERQSPDKTAVARRRRLPWRRLIAGLLLLAVGAALLAPRPPEVQLASVQQTTPSQQYAQLTASGYVVAQRRAAVASKASGRLIELTVREGSVLKKDELIARIDASDVRASIAAAAAGVRLAEAGTRQAESAVQQARVEQANAEAEYRRSQDLQAQGFVSTQALEALKRRLDAARAGLASAQAGAGSAHAGVQQAQAQLNLQQVNRDFTEIRAPFDGVVLVKNANVGDIITPFSNAAGSQGAVVTMADLSTLEVEADVSEASLAKVSAGQPVEITLDALPGQRFAGQVAGIVPTVDRAKATVMTKVRFEQLDARILPEMSAKVVFLSQKPTAAELQAVLAVNPKTLSERDGKTWLFRVKREGDKDLAETVEVRRGRTLGDLVEVSGSGLSSGDRLVLEPPAKLANGAAVKLGAKP